MARIYMLLLIAVLLVATVRAQHNTQTFQLLDSCDWVLKMTTGSDRSAATDATISIYILKPLGTNYAIGNLNRYNRLRGPNAPRNYHPFRVSQTDYFEFKGPCSPFVCSITFENGGTGPYPAWQLASAEANVTFSGALLRELKANVNTWVGGNGADKYGVEMTVNFCTGVVTTGATKPTQTIN